ncbi:MAG: hypothetical protein WA012_10675 [Rhodoferax sp.]|uniref:hypothetical protein n=1 Tax=Rhodoferax sp. TaxID=50421 RepID=UPI003BB50294
MNSPVIANAVKQSMSLDCMDCRATLAVTKTLFKVRVRYRSGFWRLALTVLFSSSRGRRPWQSKPFEAWIATPLRGSQ